MISTRTRVCFISAVLLWGAAGYRAHLENRACREWNATHEQQPQAQPNGEEAIMISPCDRTLETTNTEVLLVFAGFVSLVASLVCLAKDLRSR